MNERIIRYTDTAVLSLIAAVLVLSVIFPSYLFPEAAIFYKTGIVLCSFIYIMASKFFRINQEPLETPVDGPLFLLFAWVWISVPLSDNHAMSLNAAVSFCVFLLFYYLMYVYSRRHFRYIAFFLISIAVIACFKGLHQYFFGFTDDLNNLSPATPGFLDIKARLESGRIFSFFIYPNAFAGYLILLIPPVFGFIRTERKYRFIFISVAVLMLACLVLTKSAGAFAALFTAVLLSFLFRDVHLKKYRMLMGAFLGLCAAGLVFIVYARGADSLFSSLSGKSESFFYMLSLIKNSLFSGHGPGLFETAYNNLRPENISYLKFAHNAPLQVIIELGLTGLVLFAYLLFRGYRSIIKNFYFLRTPTTKTHVLAFLTGITASLIHNLSDFDIYNLEITLLFTALCASLMSQVKIGHLELRKFKLSYLLGINPGLRRDIIFAFIIAILVLSAVTGLKHPYAYSAAGILVAGGFGLWAISKEDFKITGLEIPAGILILLSLFSILYTPDIHSGINSLKLILSAATIFYLCSQFLRRSDYRIILANILVWAGIALSAAAWGQLIFSAVTGRPAEMNGFFPNKNLLAGYLIISFSLLLNRLLLEKKIDHLALKITGLAFITLTVSALNSRGGMLALLFIFFAACLYYYFSRDNVKDTPARITFKSKFISIAALLLIIASFTGISPSGNKIISVKEDPFYFNRLSIFGSALKMAADKPLLGHGIGSFAGIFPAYNFPIDAPARYQMQADFAHNEYLQAAAELGFLGLAALLALLFFIFKNIPANREHKKNWAAEAGAYFALAGIALHSIVDFNLHLPGIFFTAAVLASIAVPEKGSISTLSKEALVFTKVHYFPALILTAVIFSMAIRPAVAYYAKDKWNKTAGVSLLDMALLTEPFNAETLYEKGLYAEKTGNIQEALSFFEKVSIYSKHHTLSLLHAARAGNLLNNPSLAEEYYELAIKSNPYRVFTLMEFSNFLINQKNDLPRAEILLNKSLEYEPNYASARHNLALIYRSKGDPKRALQELNQVEFILSSVIPRTDYETDLLNFPDIHILYFNKALILNQLGKKDEACEYLKDAANLKRMPEFIRKFPEICGKRAK
ncbi:MAG: O-antigen ligase family protein [Candidatus Goldbacteria bacterium]|nr:O-antigen ligase family protein [Candidatus Goldiibacteriota bacterium]